MPQPSLCLIVSRFAAKVKRERSEIHTEKPKNGKKMGRPTDNPKSYRIGLRLDAQAKAILNLYCEKNNVSITDAVNTAIKQLTEKK